MPIFPGAHAACLRDHEPGDAQLHENIVDVLPGPELIQEININRWVPSL